ncbi:protein phosphatase 1 regulatory subunit 12B-like [Genypterus blacodes]|uniref:protein phosphatase 1 regulatory subunit 12B-like n=1 Tax=Genypterus blacodes TaxID=154954 RepID=UPI003F75EBFA
MSSLLSHNKDQPRIRKTISDSSPASTTAATKSTRHERLSRLNSSGSCDLSNDTANHAESYLTRRANRLSARKKAEEEAGECSDYKKMYEEALATNERLKSRLETSKQELVLVQAKMGRVQQRDARDSGSNMLETEKKETQSLKKKISDMEDQVKVKSELKMENQRLKDENGALIRVISKLSK